MRRVIRSTVEEKPAIKSVLGFGSFFRGEPFQDIDLLFLTDCRENELVENIRYVRKRLQAELSFFKVEIDMLFLTTQEIARLPRRDELQLVELYSRA